MQRYRIQEKRIHLQWKHTEFYQKKTLSEQEVNRVQEKNSFFYYYKQEFLTSALPVCRIDCIDIPGAVWGLEVDVAALGNVNHIAHAAGNHAAIDLNLQMSL